MDEYVQSLRKAELFTTLDAYSCYWQISIHDIHRSKTAFVCHAGSYQYRWMQFGPTDAPDIFQHPLNMVISKLRWNICLVYLEDFMVYSKIVDDHILHVDEILAALNYAAVTLMIKKYCFFQKSIRNHCHMVKSGKMESDPDNPKSLRQDQPPTTKTKLRSFLGLFNLYIPLIANFT